MNKLSSVVWACTPQFPVSVEQADEVRELVATTLHDLADQVNAKIQDFPETEEPKEEEVIIITSPPP